jgi:hypothetical protein
MLYIEHSAYQVWYVTLRDQQKAILTTPIDKYVKGKSKGKVISVLN